MRRVLVLMLVGIIAGCGFDPYPLPVGPPHAGQRNPIALGKPVQGVILFIQVRPGDRIEFLGAEPVGVAAGADVRFYFSPPVLHADGDTVIGEQLEPLEGAVAETDVGASSGPGNTIGIVAEITAHQLGRYVLTSVRLRYRLNGGSDRTGEGIDVVFTVCAADPAPSSCEE